MKEIQHLYLTSPIPPSVNHYLGYRAIIKNGKSMATSYKTSEAKKYQKEFENYIRNQVKEQNWNLTPNEQQHFYVDAIFYFDRIDKDPNNYFKCSLDAITETGLIWLDDNVVCERVQRIYYDSKNPRLELDIYPVDYIGIFNDISQLEQFETNCIGCNRYKRNCSILHSAIEGRIQDDIVDFQCLKYKKQNKV